MQRIKAASEHFIETEKKKREKAYQGESEAHSLSLDSFKSLLIWFRYFAISALSVLSLGHGVWI